MPQLNHLDVIVQELGVQGFEWHDIMLLQADYSFAPYSLIGLDAILHLCLAARKGPTPVFRSLF